MAVCRCLLRHLCLLCLPADDPIPTLLSFNRPPPSSAEKAASAAAATAAASKAPQQQLEVSGSSGSSSNGGSSGAQPLAGTCASAGLGSANNIQAAPQLAAASAAQQRLQRVASHVAVEGQAGKDRLSAGQAAATVPPPSHALAARQHFC
jgi:hypothetical protein